MLLLGQLEIDMVSLISYVKYLLIAILGGISMFSWVVPEVKGLIANHRKTRADLTPLALGTAIAYKRKESDRSSDMPPPVGFAAHLKIIQESAPNADPTVWWEYALQELSEAEVAITEAKLARKPLATKE